MKFDQDLFKSLWYELNPRVRCAFGNVSNPGCTTSISACVSDFRQSPEIRQSFKLYPDGVISTYTLECEFLCQLDRDLVFFRQELFFAGIRAPLAAVITNRQS